MNPRLPFLLVSCAVIALAGCSAPTGVSAAAPPAPSRSAAPSVPSVDLNSLDWSIIELPVSALQPALSPTAAGDGTTVGLMCASPNDWSKAVPSAWVAFRDAQALVPDPDRKPSEFDPHPGWWLRLAAPVIGQLGDGRRIAAVPMTCGPTDGNGFSNLLLIFDPAGGTPARPHLIGIYQPTGSFGATDVTITGGHIAVSWRTLGPNDARANPSVGHSGTIDPVGGRLVPSWPDEGGLRAILWEESIDGGASSASPSAAGEPEPTSTAMVDLAGVDWTSFTLPTKPLATALTGLRCGPSESVLRATFPDGLVRFRTQPAIKEVIDGGHVAAYVPDPAVTIRPGMPGKAAWLLEVSAPVVGMLDGGTQVAAFSLKCRAAFPADGWPVALVVVDGTGAGPTPLGIYRGGQFVDGVAVTDHKVVARVGDAGPWQGTLTVVEASGRVVSSLQPGPGYKQETRWQDVELWTRN